MKLGLYSITYRGVWYRGPAIDLFNLLRLAKQQGWEGRGTGRRAAARGADGSRPPTTARRLRDLAGELGIAISAVSPNCDLSSPVPVQREAMICYVRECIRLARDLGAPMCKIFAAWRGITLYDGLATYDDTYGYNQYGYWKHDRRPLVSTASASWPKWPRTTAMVLAMQNHGPDIVNRYEDVLALIARWARRRSRRAWTSTSSPRPIRRSMPARWPGPAGPAGALSSERRVSRAAGWRRGVWRPAAISTIASGGGRWPIRPISTPWRRRIPTAISTGSFAIRPSKNGEPAGIDYVHDQTQMALEYMRRLRGEAGEGEVGADCRVGRAQRAPPKRSQKQGVRSQNAENGAYASPPKPVARPSAF